MTAPIVPPGLRSELCPVTYFDRHTKQHTYLCAVSSAKSLVHSLELPKAFSPREIAIIESQASHPAAHDCIVGRYAAKLALSAHFLSEELLDFPVLRGTLGQPTLHCRHEFVPEISISHADGIGIAVLAPPGSPIGIDFETCGGIDQEILARQLGSEERGIMAQFEPDESRRHLRLWTMKEALVKALRCGLTLPMEFLAVADIREDDVDGHLRAKLKHFPVFMAHSWQIGCTIVSLVIPSNLGISVDIQRITSIVAACRDDL